MRKPVGPYIDFLPYPARNIWLIPETFVESLPVRKFVDYHRPYHSLVVIEDGSSKKEISFLLQYSYLFEVFRTYFHTSFDGAGIGSVKGNKKKLHNYMVLNDRAFKINH